MADTCQVAIEDTRDAYMDTFHGCECYLNSRIIEAVFGNQEAIDLMTDVHAEQHEVFCPVFTAYLRLEAVLYGLSY